MTRKEFTMAFVTQFLASYAAANYDDCAIRGNWDRISKFAPVEDAEELAKDVWESPAFQQVWSENL